MAPIKWLFFDVGSTLVDETEAYNHRIQDMIAGTEISFETFVKKQIFFASQGLDGHSEAIRFFCLKKTPWHTEDEIPFPDAAETLKTLKAHGYRLGVIANQVPGTERRLADWGLRPYLDVIAASAELGMAKPDEKIFHKALRMAKCRAEEAVMIGDRLDNDIIPAKRLGMKTVWLRKGSAAYQKPALGAGVADYQIDALGELEYIF